MANNKRIVDAYHGSGTVSDGLLRGKTDMGYSYLNCLMCKDEILRILDYKILSEKLGNQYNCKLQSVAKEASQLALSRAAISQSIIEINKMKVIFKIMKRLFVRNKNGQDLLKYFGERPQTRKQRLLEDCKKNDISIYIDNPSEQSSGIYAGFRGIVSEAELEQRLNAKKTVDQSNRANVIAVIVLVVSVVTLVKSCL